jgi:hypothetical protein
MNKLKKIKLFLVAIVVIFVTVACEKDLYENIINQDKQINIKPISLEKFNSKMRQLKNKPEIERFMVSSENNLALSRAESTSGFEIITDDIKEITQGDYTSYTLYVKTPDTTKSIYNITIEEVNNTTLLFLTKYEPTNNWKITSNRNFEGNIKTYRISGIIDDPVVLTSLLTEAFEGLQEGASNGTVAGSGGSSTSNSYPYDCNGIVQTTIHLIPYQCGCDPNHWPWQECKCDNILPGYNVVYEYLCIPDYTPIDGDTPDNPGGGTGGVGTNTGDNNTGGTSLTTIVDPTEECNAPRGDLNNDCVLDDNESNFVTFLDNLTTQERQLVIGNNNTKMSIFNYLRNQNWSNESKQFAKELIDSSIESGLNLDIEKSLKSPTNVDVTSIDTTSVEGQKFNCVYKKLMESPSFKNLVNNTFGGSDKINLKFKIVQNLSHTQPNGTITYPNGTSKLNKNVAFGVTYYNNTIKLSGNKLLSTTANKSNFEIAKTIIHEIIHAYLNIKRKGCSAASIPEVNSHLFPELISSFYTAGCSIDVNNTDQSEHAFMFDHMIPAFQMIFAEIRDILATPNNISEAEGVYYDNNDQPYNWNWQDFYKYFSMNGLHNNNAFTTAIISNPSNNFLYAFYVEKGQQFSKTCN